MTTRPSASLVHVAACRPLRFQDEVKRGNTNAAPKAPPYRGEEAPAPGPEVFKRPPRSLCSLPPKRASASFGRPDGG